MEKKFGTKLLHDYVIITLKTEEKTKSGLYIPTSQQEKQLKGVVKMIGKDVDDEDLKVGSTVIFDRLNSSPSPEGDENDMMCQYDDVIMIIPEVTQEK